MHKLIHQNLLHFWEIFSRSINGEVLKNESYTIVTTNILEPFLNVVLQNKLQDKTSLEKIISYFQQKQLPFCWWIENNKSNVELIDYFNKQNPQLNYQVAPYGEVCGMGANIDQMNLDYQLPAEFSIEWIETSHDLNVWQQPLQISFGMQAQNMKAYVNCFAQLLQTHPTIRHLMIKKDGKAISSLTLFLDEKNQVASLYNGGTLPDFRRKGLLSALGKEALGYAFRQGFNRVTLTASPDNTSVCMKSGLEIYQRYQVFLLSAH